MRYELLPFLGWTLLFSFFLFCLAVIAGERNNMLFPIVAFAAVLAFLWILFQRLERIEQKLDKLLEQKKEE